MSAANLTDTKGRIRIAAAWISSGRRTSRAFDDCLENGDGDVVAAALWARARKNPETKLAKNISRYLNPPKE